MYLLPLFLPFLNLVISCLLGKFLGKKIMVFFVINMAAAVLSSFFIFFEVGINKSVCFIDLGNWFHIGLLRLNWVFMFDSITSVMLVLVVFVSFLVHLYSMDYMNGDPHIIRFLGYLSLFTFFMLILVTSGNFVQLFLGWEGVGLSSYLLINFWYTRVQANKSAMKAIIVNRFGDFGIYFALLIMFFYFKSFDFGVVFSLVPYLANNVFLNFLNFSFNSIDFLVFFLFLGAIGKSAQLGLHTWLPDAMEGPTPVSALIHAATMVTAGVFVLIRSSPILEYSPTGLFLVSLIGGLTAFFAGTAGLVQYDIKKVIAYSTCSQLGYMFFACGMSNYSVGLFHLFNHGFFKALLFLGAGSVIHALLDEQDMRKMGGMVKLLPLTYVAILVGSLSLTGFPFLTGFYSKEVVLEIALTKFSFNSFFIYWLGVLAAFITSFYSIRLIYLVFFSTPNSNSRSVSFSHESSSYISYVLSFLGFLSIFIGFVFKDVFIGLGSDFWANSIFTLYTHNEILYAEFLDYYFKLIPLVFSIFGMVTSLLIYFIFYNSTLLIVTNDLLRSLYFFFVKKWYFDLIYNNIFVFNFLSLCYNLTFKTIDRGLVEVFGPLSLVRLIGKSSAILSFFQTGFLYNYIFIVLLGIIVFLKIVFSISIFSGVYVNFGLFACLLVFSIFLSFFKKAG
jgi:NADH-ubiquinone oxidoreductase chain 5